MAVLREPPSGVILLHGVHNHFVEEKPVVLVDQASGFDVEADRWFEALLTMVRR